MRKCIQAVSTNTNQCLHFVDSVTFYVLCTPTVLLLSCPHSSNQPSSEIQQPTCCNSLEAGVINMNALMINWSVVHAILDIVQS